MSQHTNHRQSKTRAQLELVLHLRLKLPNGQRPNLTSETERVWAGFRYTSFFFGSHGGSERFLVDFFVLHEAFIFFEGGLDFMRDGRTEKCAFQAFWR